MNPYKMLSFTVLFILSVWISPAPASAQGITISFQVFYDQLDPYGQWIYDPVYGYIWRPNVSGFEPYSSNGYWIYTDYGWTWVSNYSWGWAPFHYGRWDRRPSIGWIWIPDYEWGPAWVNWRRSPGYYGWAPMGYGNNNDYYDDHSRWRFVRDRDFGRTDIHNYYISRTNNVTIIKNSTVIKSHGPDVNDLKKQGGREFNPVKVGSYNKPGQNLTKEKLEIYRPQVERYSGGQKPVPSKVADPSHIGGAKAAPKKMEPAKSGGMKPSPQKETSPNSGGLKPQPQQQKPYNSGGMKPQPQPQRPSNSGGMKPQPQRTAPSNNGGMKQSPPHLQPQRPTPFNSGGMPRPPQQHQQQPNPGKPGGDNHPPKNK